MAAAAAAAAAATRARARFVSVGRSLIHDRRATFTAHVAFSARAPARANFLQRLRSPSAFALQRRWRRRRWRWWRRRDALEPFSDGDGIDLFSGSMSERLQTRRLDTPAFCIGACFARRRAALRRIFLCGAQLQHEFSDVGELRSISRALRSLRR